MNATRREPRSPRLLLVGPITRDVAALVDRVPEPGDAVDAVDFRTSVGGKGGTAALVATALGVRVGLIGAVGADDQGDLAVAELAAAGVEVELIERLAAESTGHVLTWIGSDAARRHVEWHGANERAACSTAEVALAATGAAAVLVSGASPPALVEAAVAGGRTADTRVVLDAAGDPETTRRVLAEVDVLRGDAEEIEALVGGPVEGFDSAAAAARRLLDAGPTLVAVQAGEEGDLVLAADGEESRLPHLDVDVIDPTGAGDAFVTTLTVLLGRGRPLGEAARLASAAAAHTASHLGGRPTFGDESSLARLLAEHPPRPTADGAGATR